MSEHVHLSVHKVPAATKNADRHCACGETICNAEIPTKPDNRRWGCLLIKGHAGLHDNPKIADAALYWRRTP